MNNKGIMNKKFYTLILLIISIISTGCNKIVEKEHIKWSGVEAPNKIDDLRNKTVGLIEFDENRPHVYCSGVWINGKILTAAHCVDLGSEVTYAVQEDFAQLGEPVFNYSKGIVVKRDESKDLALIYIEKGGKKGGFSKLGTAKVGDKVYMMGHLIGLWYTYMSGEISAKRDFLPEDMRPSGLTCGFWQVNGNTGKGMSGGGLYNEAGELIGITSVIIRDFNIAFYIGEWEIRKFLNE